MGAITDNRLEYILNKLLITGVHGFVGSNLVYKFQHLYSIYGLDIIKQTKPGVIETFLWDDFSNLPLSDTIIHLAGKAHDLKKTSSESSYFDINYGLTVKIYDYFLKSDSKTFVFFSSVKAIADTVNEPLSENILPNPITAYGKSKLKAEQYILDNLPSNKTVIILRPCMIHGPGNKGNLNLLYDIVSKGIPWPLGAYNNSRSFLSIDNLCFVINAILESKLSTGIYNVADDEPVSTNDLVKMISIVNKKKERIWNIPKGIIETIAKVGNFLPLPLNEERLQKLTEHYIVSNKKIVEALSCSLPLTATEGLKKTFNYFNSSDK